MREASGGKKLTLMIIPDGGNESRTIHMSYRSLRVLAVAGSFIALALTVMAGSWWYLAARASRAGELELQLEAMEVDRTRIQTLARQLEVIEQQYGNIRDLFGRVQTDTPTGVWLPPASGSRRSGTRARRPDAGPSLPTVWPLTEKGLVTQEHLEGSEGDHPGVDIAVPTDSYIRAAGGGTVIDVGEDPVYGWFVVIDHGDGYTTLYGHASLNLVTRGQRVREREVIALSGSTGRSTAPHLHFTVYLNGEAVDPFTLVTQPT